MNIWLEIGLTIVGLFIVGLAGYVALFRND